MGERGRVFSGPRAKLLINGKVVGYVTDVNGSEEIEYLPVDVINNIYTEEFVPVAYRVSFSASLVRIVGETMKGEGFFPRLGDGSSQVLLDNILKTEDLTVIVEDNQTNSMICQLEGVKITSKSFTVTARGLVGKNLTFLAIRMRDETETA